MPPYRVNAKNQATMNIIIYGAQGVGKTVLGGSAQDHPDLAPVLFVNIEGGLKSIAARGDIDAEDVGSTAELEELFWKLANKDPEYAKYRTVVIDSVTELQTLNLEEIVAKAVASKTGKNANRTTADEVWMDDYGKSTVQLKRLLRWFKDLPINVIITALPKKVYPKGKKDEDKEPSEILPSLTSKLGDSLMGYVDYVWYMFSEERENDEVIRYILTRDKGVYRAKTRGMNFSEAMGPVVTNPNMKDLYDLFLKSEGTKKK